MNEKKSLTPIYAVAVIGDLCLSLLQVLNILYGVMLGASPWQTGLIGSGYGLTYLIMAAVLGRLGDKIPRKLSILISLIFQLSIALFYLIFASTIVHLILGQIFLGIAYGFFWPSIEAHISENTSYSFKLHQKAISNFCISWSIGYMIGPFLAGYFSDYGVKFGFLMVFSVIIVSFLLTLGSMKFQKSDNSDALIQKDEFINTEANHQKMSGFLIRILFGMLIYAMLGKIVLVYFADFASRSTGLNLAGVAVGILLFSYGIGRTFYFVLSRRIESSLKRMNISYLIIAGFLYSLIFINSYVLLFIIFLFFGITTGLIYKTSLELLLHYEKEAKGAKAGLFESAIGLGSAFSPLIAGIVAEISLLLPFLIFGTLALIIFFINILIKKKTENK